MIDSVKIPRLIIFFFVIDLLLIFLYLINWGIGQPFLKLTSLLDVDGEKSLPTWYSSIQLFTIAIFFFVFAFENFNYKNAQTWFLILFPILFLTLSLDEIVQIHEWFGVKSDILLKGGTRKNTAFHITGIWMILLGIPFAALMLFLFHFLKRYLDERKVILKKYIVGLLIFIGSAAGIEALSNFLVAEKSTAFMILACLEEMGEMIGATFILWATYDLNLFHNISIQIPPLGRTRSRDNLTN